MYVHPRSVIQRSFPLWEVPDEVSCRHPDVALLPSGRLILVYLECSTDEDGGWVQTLMVLASETVGRSWYKLNELITHRASEGQERLSGPRITSLPDGRLVVMIDQEPIDHFSPHLPPGILVFWTDDSGQSWRGPSQMPFPGYAMDGMRPLPDGRIGVCLQVQRPDTRQFAIAMYCSEDGGRTWYEQGDVMHQEGRHFAQPSFLTLADGRWACVATEEQAAGLPNFVAFSEDQGETWGPPRILPFSLHRPRARQIQDFRVLVSGRQVNGGLGSFLWMGDLEEEAGTWQVGGPRQEYSLEITQEEIVIEHLPHTECRYTLLPPWSGRSDVLFEAEMMVAGDPAEPVAIMSLSRLRTGRGPAVLYISSTWVALGDCEPESRRRCNMTHYRKVVMRARGGVIEVLVDDRVRERTIVWPEPEPFDDNRIDDTGRRTQFGQFSDSGWSYWKAVRYEVDNPAPGPNVLYSWSGCSGEWPDEYHHARAVQTHGLELEQEPYPDYGYTSWVQFGDGHVFVVDYSNHQAPPGTTRLYGVVLEPADIKKYTDPKYGSGSR